MVCPIWGTPSIDKPNDGRDGRLLDSPRAGGDYFVSGTAIAVLENCDDRTKARLTSWLTEQRRLGNLCPSITTYTINEAKQRRAMPLSQRADSILRFLELHSTHIGATLSFRFYGYFYDEFIPDDLDRVYFGLISYSECVDRDELIFLLNYLNETGLIDYDDVHGEIKTCTITVDGYAKLTELNEKNVDSSRAFVAMWFNECMTDAWQLGFRPAIDGTGFEPVRIDQTEHVNKIDDEIIAEIRRARFLVADFTHSDDGARGGVYYEAGFAHGLGIPVIFTCRSDVFANVHFDTRQYNHIVWDEPADLQTKLSRRIGAVIGDSP